MKKGWFSKTIVLTALSGICLVCGCLGLSESIEAKASSGEIATSITKIEMIDGSNVIFYLSEADFITSPLPESIDSVDDYKWVEQITYENRANGNVHNAHLHQNLDAYNYQQKVLIDGVALSNYEYNLFANRFQRVDGLGFTFSQDVLTNATEIVFEAGCTLPTLTYSYFGEGEYSALVLEEDAIFRKRNGEWFSVHSFEGYQANTAYDASEQFFYKRSPDGNYKTHAEAPTCEFATNLSDVGDTGYALVSTVDTLKGNVMVLEFVNPIDSNRFGTINLKFYVHKTRTMTTYNASGVTEESLGEKTENVSASIGWSTVSLMAPLYADENGMVDTIVFEFTNDGREETVYNQVALGEFSLGENENHDLVYDKSLMIEENEEDYKLVFRFNKKGDFTSNLVDTSKVLINGVSLEEINADGDYVTAEWVSLQGIYQINITLLKDYTGAAQIKHSAEDYACNKISVLKGLAFPNGEVLNATYMYSIYRHYSDSQIFEKEVLIEKETDQKFGKTKAEYADWDIQAHSNNNIHFYIQFDKMIANSGYFHACEAEAWRDILESIGLYDKELTTAYIAGGYKSSLMENIVINGKTLGDFHATNTHQTCVFVHYGQTSLYNLDISIDANATDYAAFKELFESGEGVTVEIKKGLKFVTGVATQEDYTFVLKNGAFVLDNSGQDISVFFDGQRVENGETLKCDYKAITESIFVKGVDEYAVTTKTNGDTATFIIAYNGGEFTFHVQQNIVKAPDKAQNSGCSATGSGMAVIMLSLAAAVLARRKENEK